MKLRPLLITAIILGVLTAVIFSSCENPFIEKILGPKDDVSTPGGDPVFVAVTDICDVPEIGFVGTPLILSGNVYPPNATYKTIEWFYEGDADDIGFEEYTLYVSEDVTEEVTVTVKAVVENGTAEGEDFEKTFTIEFVIPVDAETPTINSQTETEDKTYSQGETVVLEVEVAEVEDGGTLSYQWYRNTEKINEGGIEIIGATEKRYTPPTDAVGTFYYYVIVTNTNDNVNREQIVTVTSDVMVVVVNEVFVPEYKIGETGPGGGIIFYVADGQDDRPLGFTVEGYNGTTGSFESYTAYYLEVALDDLSNNALWGDYGELIANVTTDDDTFPSEIIDTIGNGRKDTLIIVNHLAINTNQTGRAAQLCDDYEGGDKYDWFLPSIGELYMIQQSNLDIISGRYWSSSQIDTRNAWSMYLSSYGYDADSVSKDDNTYYPCSVRPIRAF